MAEKTTGELDMISDLFALHAELDTMDFIKGAEGQIQSRSYKYQDLPSLMAQLRPVLRRHNFVWYTAPTIKDGEPSLTYRLIHKSGTITEGEMLLMLKSPDPQGQGSSITYARRYAISAMLDIVSEEDDDGAKGTAVAQTAQKTKEDTAKPITEQTKGNIYLLIKKLNIAPEDYQKTLGKQIDSLSELEGNQAIVELMTALKKQAATQ